jgi:RNA polymerase sigma-70 factor (ECF subfamily)
MLLTETAAPTAEELIRAHQDSVWRFLVSLGCETNLADDLTQETFLKVLRGFEYKGPRETTAWLLRVAKNCYIDAIRSRKESVGIELQEADTRWLEFDGQCDYEQRIQYLRDCMKSLPGRSREAVKLRYELDLPREEMAARLGIAPAGVKTLLERIRQSLRDCVQGKADDDRA